MTVDQTAARLLAALRAAGCDLFIEEDQLFCTPPARRVEWDGDVEEAIETWDAELKELVAAERMTIH